MRYKVVKEMWTPDGMDCEHPLCESIHKPYHERTRHFPYWFCNKPMAERTEWGINDTETGKHITVDGETRFDLKRDAVKALEWHLNPLNPRGIQREAQ